MTKKPLPTITASVRLDAVALAGLHQYFAHSNVVGTDTVSGVARKATDILWDIVKQQAEQKGSELGQDMSLDQAIEYLKRHARMKDKSVNKGNVLREISNSLVNERTKDISSILNGE